MLAIYTVDSVYLSSHEVARLAGVSPSTVLVWIDQGKLHAHRTPGKHRRVSREVLVAFMREHGMPIPRELTSRLLVIDDDPAFLRTVQRVLKRRAPQLIVETANGAIDGLLKVGTWRPDAVLLDAYMPGMDGVEVCKRLRASPETANILVVALTGRPSPELAAAFRKAQAVACLVKPLDLEELLKALGWQTAVSERVRER